MESNESSFVFLGIVALSGLVLFGLWGCPQYYVYNQKLAGLAELQRAESNRQIAIQEAHAKRESAKLLSEADVIRAEGAAQANKIIGDSLKDNEAYLRYLWIQNLEQGSNRETVYIPTEAGLPILEANRLGK